MKNYTFEQIRKATYEDRSDTKDCSSPAKVYVTRHINGYVRKGDKKEAVDYLVEKGLLK